MLSYTVEDKPLYTVEEDKDEREFRLLLEQEKQEEELAQTLMQQPAETEQKSDKPNLFRKLRKDSGLAVSYIADKLDVTPATIYSWETNKVTPNPNKIKRFFSLVGHTDYPGYDENEVIPFKDKDKKETETIVSKGKVDISDQIAELIKDAENQIVDLLGPKLKVTLKLKITNLKD